MKTKLILLIGLLLSSCASGEFYTAPEGSVASVNELQVCVTYKVLSNRGGTVYNCYFFEKGHGYKAGDKYPDFEKHKKGLSYEIR